MMFYDPIPLNPMYKILGGDNKEYGPVSAEVLRQWIAERRANGQTRVQSEGQAAFVALAQLPEFQAALAEAAVITSRAPGAPTPPLSAPPSPPASKGLAVASLVCGIAAYFPLPLLAALPAIVLGHLALNRIRRDPAAHAGRGQAIAGLILGYLNFAFVFLVAIGAAIALPALAKAKGQSQTVYCVNNLKQIALASRLYANDHNDTFPSTFLAMSNELNTPKILVCPGDGNHERALDWASFSESANVTYEFVSPGLKFTDAAAQQTVFRCPIHNNVARGDGSVFQLSRHGNR